MEHAAEPSADHDSSGCGGIGDKSSPSMSVVVSELLCSPLKSAETTERWSQKRVQSVQPEDGHSAHVQWAWACLNEEQPRPLPSSNAGMQPDKVCPVME